MRDAIKHIFDGSAILAPMLATTDIPFRRICREYGAGLVHTEMVSTLGIARSSREAFRNATFDPSERPVAIQVVASTADSIAHAIRELLPQQPTVFDINCGCPDHRICEAGAGAALLDDPPSFAAVIRAAVGASDVPVSVKIRARGNHRSSDVTTNARIAEDNGAAYLTVHARSRFAPYDQPAAWEQIARAKDAVAIPVIGNGDVFSADDARRMREETGCDAVMIARGCLGAPWIFRDVLHARTGSVSQHVPESGMLLDLVRRHVAWVEREFGPVHAIPRIRKHVMWYTRHFKGNESLRGQLFLRDDLAFIREAIDAYLSSDPPRADPDSPEAREREQNFRTRVLYWMDTRSADV